MDMDMEIGCRKISTEQDARETDEYRNAKFMHYANQIAGTHGG